MSSSDIAVSVRGLSKSYTIAHQGEKHSTLAETLLAKARHPFQRAPKETFWALKDVNFDIKKGEVVGIIGRNGAGKSTLLKILSRITEPTAGQIDLYGRVGSLLEVGTGFHPELTGRENIFLNGAILGMTKAEIRKQFDAIVDFAGVEKFLDTPVKRYSSGMYVRLAFAVAAFLRCEILVVDEVLAVGDAQFQQKCIGKMADISSDGRTVLFVSHNIGSIRQLCDSCVFLAPGTPATTGSVETMTGKYLAGDSNSNALLPKKNGIEIIDLSLNGSDGANASQLMFAAPFSFNFRGRSSQNIEDAFFVVRIRDDEGILATSICSAEEGVVINLAGEFSVGLHFESLELLPRRYVIDLTLCTTTKDLIAFESAITFDVLPAPLGSTRWMYERRHGIFRMRCKIVANSHFPVALEVV